MIFSRLEEFSSSQAITADVAATNSYNNTAVGGAIGTEMYLVVQCDATFDNLTSLIVNLVTDTVLPIDASSTVLASKTIAAASLVAGAQVFVTRVPREQQAHVGIWYDVVGTAPSVGSVSAFLTNNIQQESPVE